MTRYNLIRLKEDAKNRSVRTFATGLAIDVGVGVTLVLLTYFKDANAWGDIEWTILGFSVFKSFIQAAGAFVLRRFLDPSEFPTPLPPADPGEPDRDEFGQLDAMYAAVMVFVLLGILYLVVQIVRTLT
jgi:hypothetical protein